MHALLNAGFRVGSRSFDVNQKHPMRSALTFSGHRSAICRRLRDGECSGSKAKDHVNGKDLPLATQQETLQTHAKYERLIARAKGVKSAKTLVVHPCDETSLRGAIEAAAADLIVPILVGPAAKISAVARTHKLDLGGIEIVDAAHSDAAAEKAVELVQAGMGEVLMKGSLHTDELMRAVTNSKTGLRTARRISHVFVLDVPTYPETLFITDAAINIFPDLDAKRDIVQNAIDLWTQTGLGTPRVAILSAVETVTSKIPSTIEAAALCKMADRGQITGGILDGPLAFDNAIDPEAAKIKGIKSRGRRPCPDPRRSRPGSRQHAREKSDIPRNADAAGLVLGARVPDHSHLARGFGARAHGLLRCRRALCRCAPPQSGRCRSVIAMDAILVVNAGSSSLKFQVFAIKGSSGELDCLVKGQIDGVGTRPRLRAEGADKKALIDQTYAADKIPDLPAAIQVAGDWLRSTQKVNLLAVGHRVVHGGPDFDRPVRGDPGGRHAARTLRLAGAAASTEQSCSDTSTS